METDYVGIEICPLIFNSFDAQWLVFISAEMLLNNSFRNMYPIKNPSNLS